MKWIVAALWIACSLTLNAEEKWDPVKDPVINGRAIEIIRQDLKTEWGYTTPQQCTYIVVHPKEERKNAPLYVVLHSAGHDVMSCLNARARSAITTSTARPMIFTRSIWIAAKPRVIGGGAGCI